MKTSLPSCAIELCMRHSTRQAAPSIMRSANGVWTSRTAGRPPSATRGEQRERSLSLLPSHVLPSHSLLFVFFLAPLLGCFDLLSRWLILLIFLSFLLLALIFLLFCQFGYSRWLELDARNCWHQWATLSLRSSCSLEWFVFPCPPSVFRSFLCLSWFHRLSLCLFAFHCFFFAFFLSTYLCACLSTLDPSTNLNLRSWHVGSRQWRHDHRRVSLAFLLVGDHEGALVDVCLHFICIPVFSELFAQLFSLSLFLTPFILSHFFVFCSFFFVLVVVTWRTWVQRRRRFCWTRRWSPSIRWAASASLRRVLLSVHLCPARSLFPLPSPFLPSTSFYVLLTSLCVYFLSIPIFAISLSVSFCSGSSWHSRSSCGQDISRPKRRRRGSLDWQARWWNRCSSLQSSRSWASHHSQGMWMCCWLVAKCLLPLCLVSVSHAFLFAFPLSSSIRISRWSSSLCLCALYLLSHCSVLLFFLLVSGWIWVWTLIKPSLSAIYGSIKILVSSRSNILLLFLRMLLWCSNS